MPILACLEEKNSENKEGLSEILIVPFEKELVPQSFKIAKKIRNESKKVNVEIFYGYKLKKAFEYCDYLGIEKLIIVGKKDIENNEYVIKNLKTKEEEKITFQF